MELENLINKDSLHHAYLIEGSSEKLIPEILSFLKNISIQTSQNPDFCQIQTDVFKIEDARNLKTMQEEKTFTQTKRIFLISANNFLLEAQNTLLKIFEEPKKNTHFFVIVPNSQHFLKTLLSRFYLIKTDLDLNSELILAEKFLKASLKDRILLMKDLLIENTEETDIQETTSAKALRFLNSLEKILYQKLKNPSLNLQQTSFFDHFLKVRQFINQPGVSLKTLMESVALITPYF